MASDLFSQADLDRLSECIRQAELQSSGEIRVHLEKHCRGTALDRARVVFVNWAWIVPSSETECSFT